MIERSAADPNAQTAALNAYARGNLTDAQVLFRQLLDRRPDDATALQHLGLIALAQGDQTTALSLLEQAVRAHPMLAQAHSNYGNALANGGRLLDAIAHFRQAVALDPGLAQAYCNLGLALSYRGETDEAVLALRHALRLRPDLLEAHLNLGSALNAQKRTGEALDAFNAALALQPGHAGALTGIAQCLAEQGRLSQALDAYRGALHSDPRFPAAYVNLGGALLEAADVEGAIATLREGLQRHPGNAALRSNLLLALQYDPDCSAAQIVAESRAWETHCAGPPTANTSRAVVRTGAPLRIGLVSADLRAHPVGWFLRSVLPAMPRTRFEFIAYANQTASDAITGELAAACVLWRNIHGLDDAQVCAQVAQDGIDMLIDLSGHTAGNRLGVFARRAAPVQLSWLGYFATTGLSEIDHVLMDRLHVPNELDAGFTEHVEYLDPIRLCYAPPPYAPPPAPAPVLANDFITFGGFHNAAKLNQRVLDLWARILAQVPHSRLVLRWKSLDDLGLRERLREPFLRRGVAPGRVLFYAAQPHDTMLALYGEIDIALDTFPFSGATTTCEALWMGVPVITWPGVRPVSRQSAAMLRTIGHEELCAASADDYLRRAVALAGDGERLRHYRATLRATMQNSALCDARRFAHTFGNALSRIWESTPPAVHDR